MPKGCSLRISFILFTDSVLRSEPGKGLQKTLIFHNVSFASKITKTRDTVSLN